MTVLSIVEPVLLFVILAVALGGALATVESRHLRPLAMLVADINRPLQTITTVLPGIAAKAALVVRKAQGG
jgi:hypothetical protein